MGHGIFGYVEVQHADSKDWQVYKELETGDVTRSPETYLVFGTGYKSGNCATLFKNRGLPLDATDEARDDYCNKQVRTGQGKEYREMFGHSHVYANELPAFLLEKFPALADASEEYDSARLLVWFNR